jgi:hypothetical protein
VLLGYFFRTAHDNLPNIGDTHGLYSSDAILIARFGDLGLVER